MAQTWYNQTETTCVLVWFTALVFIFLYFILVACITKTVMFKKVYASYFINTENCCTFIRKIQINSKLETHTVLCRIYETKFPRIGAS